MDDATLNAQADASQGPDEDLRRIVALLEPDLGPADGAPQSLDGGITNRNFRASFRGIEYVIRVPGKDTSLLEIDREAERIANDIAARAGIAPPVAAFLTDPACIVTRFVAGRGMDSEELRSPAWLPKIASALRAIHERPEPIPVSFDSFRLVETFARTAAGRGATIPDAYEDAHRRAAEIEAALTGPEHVTVPCHDDLLAANFIAGEDPDAQLWIVDWEYAGMGDRYFDLANFAVNNGLDDGGEEELLAVYHGGDPTPSQLAALRLMRFMSDFREAMWGVVQGVVSELDFDFGDYAARHFDRMLETAADPRFDQWLGDVRGAP